MSQETSDMILALVIVYVVGCFVWAYTVRVKRLPEDLMFFATVWPVILFFYWPWLLVDFILGFKRDR